MKIKKFFLSFILILLTPTIFAATTSLPEFGVNNINLNYDFQLAAAPTSSQAECKDKICFPDLFKNGQQWITLNAPGGWIDLEYNIFRQGKICGHVGVSFSQTAGAEISNFSSGIAELSLPYNGLVDLFFLPTPPLATPAVYPDGTKVILSVQGNKIVNNHGKEILLRGFARPSLEWEHSGRKGQYLSENDFINMHKAGANIIRLELNQAFWLNSKDRTVPDSYQQIVDAMIYYAIQNHMAVIIDLHETDAGFTPLGTAGSLNFWHDVASKYKDFGTVIFELFNEPHDLTATEWLQGNGTNIFGYQALYDQVRSTGAQNICIINGLDWGYDISFVNDNLKVQGNNLIYGSHPYNEKGKSGQLASSLNYALNNYPVIFTEFGAEQDYYYPVGYQDIYQGLLNFVNQKDSIYGKQNSQLINYTGFAWWVDDNPLNRNRFPDLIADWDGTPLNGGVYVFADMKANPPTPIDM